MADERPLYEQILDMAVFAPVGAATLAAEQLPALVAKGRGVVESRVSVATMVGRLAVAQMRKKVENVVGQPGPSAGAGRGQPAEDSRAGTAGPAWTPATPEQGAPPEQGAGRTAQAGRQPRASVAVPDVGNLAIPGYDSLAASQVVRRLDSLTSDELAAVEAYEVATRGRRTVLGRIAQLQGRADAGG
jgi:hypothetical protein